MKTRSLLLIVLLYLWCAAPALADENLGGFQHLTTPTPTTRKSVVDLAPVLLPFFNNAPVFGIPGTELGNIWERTQVTGDWGGLRTDLAHHGLFFDVYSTSTYQDTTSGGIKTGSSFVQNIQTSLNIDTARAGLWQGGLIHLTAQSRYGDSPEDTFTAGTFVPQYTGLVEPDPLLSHETAFSEWFLVQALSKQTSVVLGKISDVFIPDQTLFGDSYKYFFANFNFNKNPMTTNFYHPVALAALGVWAPMKGLVFGGGVLDPNSKANNFATDAFDKVNLYGTAIASYSIGGLPGQFSPSFNWSNQPQPDFTDPFGPLVPAQIPQAVGNLLGVAPGKGLIVNEKDASWFFIANFSQYLFLTDDPASVAEKLKTGQVLNGIGIFGRIGFAPEETNQITRDASIAVFAHGMLGARQYDSFGVGFFYNEISNDLKRDVAQLTAGTSKVSDEKGVEVFYDLAITPAVRLIPSYQHIWNPFVAQVVTDQDHTDIFLTRLTVAW
jgi:porin